MAASFDDDLLYRIFNAVSDETRAKYNEARKNGQENARFLSLSVWTPNVNIFRDPRWGRGQETYGEDPYLTSRMGVSVVKGLQGPSDAKYRKLLACAKHFAVHSGPEWSRHSLNINDVNPRELWETYLPAFKSLVQKADVRQVMCAYQRLDDEPCCGSTQLLQRILRDDWGYKYMVVSDCGAISDFYTSHKVSSDAVHAVGFCNFGLDIVDLSYKDFDKLGLNGRYKVRDLWRQKDISNIETKTGELMLKVPAHANSMPAVVSVTPLPTPAMGIAVEGSEQAWPDSKEKAALPLFDSLNKKPYYLDIFNRGTGAFAFKASTNKPWIKLSSIKGIVEKENRIMQELVRQHLK